MQKLFLLFFIISIFTGKNETPKINPNIATFEELISVPILTEEEAIAIITLRTVKKFSSTHDLVERTGMDSTKADFLEEIFIFDEDIEQCIQMYGSRQQEDFTLYSKFISKKYITSSYISGGSSGIYLSNRKVTVGKFNLQISPYTFKPVFRSKNTNFNLCVTQPFTVAVGMQKLLTGFPLQIKPVSLLFSPIIIFRGKVYYQIFAKSFTNPVKLYASLSTLEKTGFLKLHFRERNTNFSAQLTVSNNKPSIDCRIIKTLKTGGSFYLKLSNREFYNASYLQYTRILPPGCAITIGASLSSRYPELYSIKIYSRSLSIRYLKGQREKVTIRTHFDSTHLRVNFYPECNSLEYKLTANLAFHSIPLKISIGWENKNTWNLSIEINKNAEKGQSDNFEGR